MSDADYRALTEAAGLARTSQQLVWARGPDAGRFLHDLLSQNVQDLERSSVARSLLLAPNGRLRAVMILANHDGDFGMLTEQHEHVLSDLRRFRIRVEVELELDERAVWMLDGPHVEGVLGAAGWSDSAGASGYGELLIIRDPAHPRRRFVVGDAAAELTRHGATPVGPEAVEICRIELGEPRFGVDVDPSTIPNEVFDLFDLVDFDKGCYLGQELVERIDARGRQVKRLAGVRLQAGAVPAAGAEIRAEDRSVGVLTSTVESVAMGVPIGIGIIRSDVAAGDPVEVHWSDSSRSGQVVSLPFLTDF